MKTMGEESIISPSCSSFLSLGFCHFLFDREITNVLKPLSRLGGFVFTLYVGISFVFCIMGDSSLLSLSSFLLIVESSNSRED